MFRIASGKPVQRDTYHARLWIDRHPCFTGARVVKPPSATSSIANTSSGYRRPPRRLRHAVKSRPGTRAAAICRVAWKLTARTARVMSPLQGCPSTHGDSGELGGAMTVRVVGVPLIRRL
jgi:hypothetical protein